LDEERPVLRFSESRFTEIRYGTIRNEGAPKAMNISIPKLQEAANGDPEFRLAARFWNTAVRLEMGDEALLLRTEKGQITEVVTGHQAFAFLTPVNNDRLAQHFRMIAYDLPYHGKSVPPRRKNGGRKSISSPKTS
jgi:hypothetical protein